MIAVTAIFQPGCFRQSRVKLKLATGLLLTALAVLLAKPVASQLWQFEVERLEGYGVLLEQILAVVDPQNNSGILRLDSVSFENEPVLSKVELSCSQLLLVPSIEYGCIDGQLSFDNISGRPFAASISRLAWQDADSDGRTSGEVLLNDVPLLGDDVSALLTQSADDNSLQVEISAPAVRLADVTEAIPMAGIELAGSAVISGELRSSNEGDIALKVSIEHRDLSFANAAFDYLGDALTGRIDLDLRFKGDDWNGQLSARWIAGELLTPYAYVEVEKNRPLSFEATLDSRDGGETLMLTGVQLQQSPWVRLDASAEITTVEEFALNRVEVTLPRAELGTLVQRYLEPVLANPLVSAARIEGKVSGSVELVGQAPPRIRVNLVDANLTDDPDLSRYSVESLSGTLFLGRPGALGELAWEKANLFRVEVGSTRLPLTFGESQVALATPTKVPVFDGALDIERFRVDWSQELPVVVFDAVLEPVSMPLLAEALDWIPMRGQLSGVIPRVSLKQGELQVGGSLLVRVFDGTLVVKNLRVSDLFGYFPVLTADISGRNLDLELLTGTYEVGRITGRLEGDISGLRLEEWKPVEFDARFQTPKDDDSKHRISQKAVDNIAGLAGGGATGMVSRGFLRFFDEFNYDRLGIACRLRNGRCEMDGVEEAKNGYYLVKGGGIPRIDVIGFNRSTDWETLVQRILAAASGGSPVIE